MRRWYGVATGGLGWTPAIFWQATLAEFFMAVEGHNDINGGGYTPLSRGEFEELAGKYW